MIKIMQPIVVFSIYYMYKDALLDDLHLFSEINYFQELNGFEKINYFTKIVLNKLKKKNS